MATKKLIKKVQRKPVVRKLAVRKAENPVIESARDIWLAGLGALAGEGKRAGRMFRENLREGSRKGGL